MRHRRFSIRSSMWLFCAGLLIFLSAAKAAASAATSPMGVADARHLLTRTGFGATPEEVADFSRLSRTQAIDRILRPVSTTSSVAVPKEIAEFTPRSEVREQRAMGDEAKKALQQEQAQRGLMLRGWWVETMLQTQIPAEALRERMVLFWHNHFVSSIAKVKSPALMYAQNQLFRTQALGSFSDLLHAASKDPAMLIYLDSATSRQGSPNENFAREVMELFTLGEGNYSEHDIKEAARAYTGWSIDPETGQFMWRPRFHDDGEKLVLGQRGNFDGDAVLDIILRKPQMAEFIVAKLWREFVSPEPDTAEVRRIAREWGGAETKAGVPRYEIRLVLRRLFESKAFWSADNRGVLIKSPVEMVVGTLHTFGLNSADGAPFAFALKQLGQDLFAPPNVRGWPGGEAWINTTTLLARKQFLERMLRSEGMNEKQRMARMRAVQGNELAMMRLRLQMALDSVHVDADGWTERARAKQLSAEQVLLAVPAETVESSAGMLPESSRDLLRRLMLGSTYQVR